MIRSNLHVSTARNTGITASDSPFVKRVSLVGTIVDRHPELFARYARELAVESNRRAR